MGVYLKLDGQQIANALESIGWQSGSGGDASVSYSATAPESASNGNLWYDTTIERLKIYNGGVWAVISMSQEEMQSITTTVDNMAGYLSTAELQATTATEQAGIATAKANEIQAMSATATTLAEGVSATASYVDGTLTIGVPVGATGAKGDKGDTGDAGYTPIKGVDYFDGADGITPDMSDYYTQAEVDAKDATLQDNIDLKADKANPTFTGLIKEQVSTSTLTLGATSSVQTYTATADFTIVDDLEDGEFVTMILTNGGFTPTYPTITWWGDAEPTLGTTDKLFFEKIGSVLYGSHVGTIA